MPRLNFPRSGFAKQRRNVLIEADVIGWQSIRIVYSRFSVVAVFPEESIDVAQSFDIEVDVDVMIQKWEERLVGIIPVWYVERISSLFPLPSSHITINHVFVSLDWVMFTSRRLVPTKIFRYSHPHCPNTTQTSPDSYILLSYLERD